MKITLAIACLQQGGTEQQTLQQARVLRDAGHDVTVCCYFEHDPAIVAAFERLGARVMLLSLDRAISAWRLTGTLRNIFASLKPDLLHVQYMTPGLLPIIAARLARVPRVFATVHQPATPYGAQARALLRLAARLCERFICVSEAAERSWFGSVNEGRHLTIHNAVDTRRIEELVRATSTSTGLVIGAVSRLRHEKGVDVLLDAFAIVQKQFPQAHLLIVGDGPDRAALEQRATPNVEWAGQQSWERAIALMATMDIVVVPSRFEGFGLTAAEAMAAGKPVVASDVDGLREVVGDAGVLVPAGDASALAAALARLANDAAARAALGRKARERVENNFSLESFRQKLLACYR